MAANAIAIGTPFKSGVASWNPSKPLGGETPSFWYQDGTRNDLTLTNSVTPGTNDAAILLPYLNLPDTNESATYDDNGALDIGDQDFTLYMWVKGETASNPVARFGLGGKFINGNVNGRYGFSCRTESKYEFGCQPTGGAFLITSEVLHTDQAWHLLLAEIDQTAKIVKFFIDNSQIGADTAYTGTFSALDNAYSFYIGCENYATTGVPRYNTCSSFRDCGILRRKLTTTEKTSLYNGIVPLGHLAYWPLNDTNFNDCSGNGRPLTGTNITSAKIKYGSGSRHGLNAGYSLYENSWKLKQYVPHDDTGQAIVAPVVSAGYTESSQHDGSLDGHNLFDSYLVMAGDVWDKSNTTIYGAAARAFAKYIVATPKHWHIEELNRTLLNTFLNPDYKGRITPKVDGNSVTDRRKLTEIIEYATNKTGADYNKLITYTGDRGYAWDIDYYFEDDFYIVTTRGDKMLIFESDRYLKLSLDNGVTFVNTIDLNGVTAIITKSKIYANGNINFCGHQKSWYSDDNLETYQESTTLDYEGNAFIPTTYNNFTIPHYYPNTVFDDYELDVWNNYSNDAGTQNDNINIWYTADSGVTVKSMLKYGSGNEWPVRHGHGVVYNPNDGAFYAMSGDGVAGAVDCRLLKCVYTKATDSWEITQIAVGGLGSFYLMGGMTFLNTEAIVSSDNNTNRGVYKVPNDELDDPDKFVKHYAYTGTITGAATDGNGVYIGNPHGTSIMIISKDYGVTFYAFYLTGGPTVASGGAFFQQVQPNNQGYFRFDPMVDTETYTEFTKGVTLMLKLI